MPGKRSDSPEPGHKFGKPDIERIGLFIEMPYITGKMYPKKNIQREDRNMLCEGPKTKNGTQHGYFEPIFKRIFSKEALKGRGRKQPQSKFKNVSERPFLPPIGFKQHSCPGDYYGTFSGIIEAFGNKRKPRQPRKSEGSNLLTNPSKKGGPGYADIGLSRYPEHKPDRYGLKPKYKEFGKNLGRAMVTAHYPQPYFDNNPFGEVPGSKTGPTYVRPKDAIDKSIPPGHFVPTGPAKLQGGCHDGCFDKWPEHKADRYGTRPKKIEKLDTVFYPPSWAEKSYYNTSVLYQKVDISVNQTNFKNATPKYTKYIVSDSI